MSFNETLTCPHCFNTHLSPLFRGRKVQLLPHDNLASLNNVDTLGQLVAAVEPPA